MQAGRAGSTAETAQRSTFALKISLQYADHFSAPFSVIAGCLPAVGTLSPSALLLAGTSAHETWSGCVHYQPVAPTLILVTSLLTSLAVRGGPGHGVLSHLQLT